jgi:hypothetical protein
LGFIAAMALVCGIVTKNKATNEPFVNVLRVSQADPLTKAHNGQTYSARNYATQDRNVEQMKMQALVNNAKMSMDKAARAGFVSVANYQQNVQNRFSPYGYTPYIRYKMPPENMQGVTPMNPTPLDYGNMVKEEYSAPKQKSRQTPEYLSTEDLMPSQTMESVNSGRIADTFQTERLMYANYKLPTRRAADLIRGDINIAPCQKNLGWFQSYLANATNLTQGALAVMGGVNNDTAKATAQLISAYSGVAPAAIAGSPITGTVAKEIGIGPHRESVSVTAFP